MCFFKKRKEEAAKVSRDFFEYLCEDFFGGGNDTSDLEYDSIISNVALELMPDVDKFLEKETDYSTEEVCEICRRIAVKSLLLIAIEDDKTGEYVRYIHENYSAELQKLLENS